MSNKKFIETWTCECGNISKSESIYPIKIKFCAICQKEMHKGKNERLTKWQKN